MSRAYAPNVNPKHQQALGENSRVFYRKIGMAAQELDNSRTAVQRKSNALLEQ